MNIKEKLKKYLDENLKEEKLFFGAEKRSMRYDADTFYDEMLAPGDIDVYINQELNDNKFQKLLFKFIDDRNLKDSDVYNKAQIDRRLFSKIRSDENYHPSKETIISLACSLELSIDELEELLSSASYSLPKNNKFDLIIRFCFLEKIYDLIEINNLLNEYHCNLLTK